MKNILSVLLISSIAFSCGSSETNEESTTDYNHSTEEASAQSEATEASTTEATSDASVAVLEIESNDMMKYNLSELKVKSGQKVKLTLKHVGKLPKESMGHNIVILKSGTDVAAFAQKAGQARENGYIADEASIIAHSNIIGGGESTTIEFDAPASGTYDFVCSFPGHYAIMKGKFIVE